MKWLNKRNRILLVREPQAGRARVANALGVAIMMVILYWQVGGASTIEI
jgi:ABC-type multidrug transport system permease subunit